MGNLRALLMVAVSALAAACGDDGAATPDAAIVIVDASPDAAPDAYVPDAQVYDFSCLNNTAPTTNATTITVTGTASTISGTSTAPAAGVTVEAHAVTADALLDTDGPTAANGGWSLGPIAVVANMPVDAYVKATLPDTGGTQNRATLVYPPQPLTADQAMVPAIIVDNAQLNTLLGFLGKSQDMAKGMLGLAVLDCAGTQVNGATVTVKQNGTTPAGIDVLDVSAFAPEAAGAFFVLNVPVDDMTEVNAMYNGMTFRAHVVKSAAATTTTTGIRPGF